MHFVYVKMLYISLINIMKVIAPLWSDITFFIWINFYWPCLMHAITAYTRSQCTLEICAGVWNCIKLMWILRNITRHITYSKYFFNIDYKCYQFVLCTFLYWSITNFRFIDLQDRLQIHCSRSYDQGQEWLIWQVGQGICCR